MKSFIQKIITFTCVLSLLALSVVLLRLPRLYFKHSDEVISGVVQTDSYDINNEIKRMNIYQIVEIMNEAEASSVIIDHMDIAWNKAMTENLLDRSLKEYIFIIFGENRHNQALEVVNNMRKGDCRNVACNLLKVDGSEIYSAALCMLEIQRNEYFSIRVLFDMDTYKILGVSITNKMTRYAMDTMDRYELLTGLKKYYGEDIPYEFLSYIILNNDNTFVDRDIYNKNIWLTVKNDYYYSDVLKRLSSSLENKKFAFQ